MRNKFDQLGTRIDKLFEIRIDPAASFSHKQIYNIIVTVS